MKLKDSEEVPAKYTGIIDRSSGSREWWVDGKRHRIQSTRPSYLAFKSAVTRKEDYDQ